MAGEFIKWLFFFIILQSSHGTKQTNTYIFPKDACSSEPYYVVDEHSVVDLRFNGGSIGSENCRKMKFTTPSKPFYHYTLCARLEYFESPDCSISIGFRQHENRYIYWDNDRIYAEGCSEYTYNYNHEFSRCFHEIDGKKTISFEIKKGGRKNNNRNGYDYRERQKATQTPTMSGNNTFKIQLEANIEPDYAMIGGLAGGLAGAVFLVAITTCICVKCRKQKRETGHYCGGCSSHSFCKNLNTEAFKEAMSHGCSTQCMFGGILLCSCVFCQKQIRQTDSYEAVPVILDVSDSKETKCDEQRIYKQGYSLMEPDSI